MYRFMQAYNIELLLARPHRNVAWRAKAFTVLLLLLRVLDSLC